VESYFYLWRITKDPKYREWGWEMLQNIEKHCKRPHGYVGVKNVWSGGSMEVQNSWFLAEVLKYLYLLFSDDDVLPLDSFVMNTEAHPIPKEASRNPLGQSTWTATATTAAA
jgi:mannosyl-oligosaccharide alpha-1,2-mannosidase